MTGRLPSSSSNEKGLAAFARAIRSRLSHFGKDRSGMGAVEFAMIAPLLLMLYITAFEITVGLSVAKRATRSAGAIADLTTQSSTVTPTDLSVMKDVASAIFAPYSTSDMTLQITGITINSAGAATVSWSWAGDNTAPYAKNDTFTLPANIATPSSFLVHARVSIPHQLLMFMPGLMPVSMQNITITREYYFRQRINEAVSCTGCPSG